MNDLRKVYFHEINYSIYEYSYREFDEDKKYYVGYYSYPKFKYDIPYRRSISEEIVNVKIPLKKEHGKISSRFDSFIVDTNSRIYKLCDDTFPRYEIYYGQTSDCYEATFYSTTDFQLLKDAIENLKQNHREICLPENTTVNCIYSSDNYKV